MCILFLEYRPVAERGVPPYRLVIASNRDEFYDRDTAPVHYWSDHPAILAGESSSLISIL